MAELPGPSAGKHFEVERGHGLAGVVAGGVKNPDAHQPQSPCKGRWLILRDRAAPYLSYFLASGRTATIRKT